MSQKHSLVIRNGTVVDGTGSEPRTADVAIDDGVITSVGKVTSNGAEEIDAKGLMVAPGFVDIHTHYDGQVTWEHQLAPSSLHGVTSVLMGNCGVGFAPCRAEDRDRLVRLMEGVEDLPEIVLTEGIPWNWETFPQYLDSLAARQFEIDIATQVPHAALRVYVMGERASDIEMATAEDRAAMARLAGEAIRAGALGFGTSRTLNHKASDGKIVPTLNAAEEELTEIAMALSGEGSGWVQIISDFKDQEAELARLRRVVEKSRRPLSLTVLQSNVERCKALMAWIEQCVADGLPVNGQVMGRPSGGLLGFDLSRNPFYMTPTFKRLKTLSLEERRRALHQADVRKQIVTETPDPDNSLGAGLLRKWDTMFPLGERPDYNPQPEDFILARAQAKGVTPEEIAYDLMMVPDCQGVLFSPTHKSMAGVLDAAAPLLRHPNTLYGLGDGGAHLGLLCDASVPTFMLQYWARDRGADKIPVQDVVKKLAWETAKAVGLNDRGVLKAGYRADVNIIDFDKVHLKGPRVRRDLPAGGARVVQEAEGYVANVVAGKVTRRNGEHTGALPGALVRGQQKAR